MRNPFATGLIAAITQLVEWLAVNQHVTGSSPVGGASFVFVSVFYSRGCFVPVCQQTGVASLFLYRCIHFPIEKGVWQFMFIKEKKVMPQKECLEVVVARDYHDPDEFDVLTDEVQRVGDADTAKGDVRETAAAGTSTGAASA